MAAAVMLTGMLNGFEFANAVDIQMHDTYLVLASLHSILIMWLLLALSRYTIIGLARISRENKAIAVVLMLITALLLTFTGLYFVLMLDFEEQLVPLHPDTAQGMSFYKVVCTGIMVGLLLIEVWLGQRVFGKKKTEG